MFNGSNEISIKSNMDENHFDELVCNAFERLGRIRIRENGEIDITPKSSFRTFWSVVTINGRIRHRDGKYRVSIDYSLSPSGGLWAIAIVLFCFLIIVGGAIILAPLIFDKPNIERAIENAFADLEDFVDESK